MLKNAPLKHLISFKNVYNQNIYQCKYLSSIFTKQDYLTNQLPNTQHPIKVLQYTNFLSNYHTRSKPLPKLVYVPNIFQWMRLKLEFWLLKQWDPNFHEGEFRYGAQKAVCAVTKALSTKNNVDLNPLVTPDVSALLLHNVEVTWTESQRRLITLEPENIQLVIPRRIHFLQDKRCEVDLVFIAVKWAEHQSKKAIVFVEAFARFHRNFTPDVVPEWTINAFRITKFDIFK